MIENFLTIPDAPNYEVNSQLVVRNKKTGKILKLNTNGNSKVFRLYSKDGKIISRSPKTYRLSALGDKQKFYPVPSTGNKYEISQKGTLRNAKTKCLLKLRKGSYVVYVDGKHKTLSKTTLLAEVFGTPMKNKPVQVTLEKNGRRIFFDSMMDAARFLAPKYFYSVASIATYLQSRREIIFDWHVRYLEGDVAWNFHGLNAQARRQKKLEGLK